MENTAKKTEGAGTFSLHVRVLENRPKEFLALVTNSGHQYEVDITLEHFYESGQLKSTAWVYSYCTCEAGDDTPCVHTRAALCKLPTAKLLQTLTRFSEIYFDDSEALSFREFLQKYGILSHFNSQETKSPKAWELLFPTASKTQATQATSNASELITARKTSTIIRRYYAVLVPVTAKSASAPFIPRPKTFELKLYYRTVRKNGGLGKFSASKWQHRKMEEYFDLSMFNLLAPIEPLMKVVSDGDDYYHWSLRVAEPRASLSFNDRELALETLQKLNLIERLFYQNEPKDEPTKLHADLDNPWQLTLQIAPYGGNNKRKKNEERLVEIKVSLNRDTSGPAQQLSLEEVTPFPGECLFLYGDKLYRYENYLSQQVLETLIASRHILIPQSHIHQVIAELLKDAPKTDFISLSKELGKIVLDERLPKGVITFMSPRESSTEDDLLIGEITFQYGDVTTPCNGATGYAYDNRTTSYFKRDKDAETALLRELDEAFHSPIALTVSPEGLCSISLKRFLNGVEDIISRGWKVLLENVLIRPSSTPSTSVSSGIDWFDVDISLSFDEINLNITDLLYALEKEQRFITLSDGSKGILPLQWLKRIKGITQLATEQDGKLRFKENQALWLDLMIDELPEVDLDSRFGEIRKRLSHFKGIAPVETGKHFHGELREYQKLGLGWLKFLREASFGGCLADDMGLGKTVQVLALLESNAEGSNPSLIVAPNSLIENWHREALRFCPHFEIRIYTGSERSECLENLGSDVIICTTYGTMLRDVEALSEIEFNYVILDEAQAIKNPQAQTTKATKLLQAKNRLALTGTPIENSIGDLYSIMNFLNPGLCVPLQALASKQAKQKANNRTLREAENALTDTALLGLRPLILRRTKEEVLSDLPPKTEKIHFLTLDPKQQRVYDDLREYHKASLGKLFEENGFEGKKLSALTALLRLRQIACHPELVSEKHRGIPSAKTEFLISELSELLKQGRKVLVFSQFTKYLALIGNELDIAKLPWTYLDGKTKDRQRVVDEFQERKDAAVFLISLKAGGVGLNLTAADYCFIADPWWNPAAENQAIDRIHRIGQEKPVFAYRLVAKGTVEEKILILQESKRETARKLIGNNDSFVKGLSASDFEFLLS